eukprot:scaffold2489_cov259-Pinguiococcus_pyrenoidosus.AAC.2
MESPLLSASAKRLSGSHIKRRGNPAKPSGAPDTRLNPLSRPQRRLSNSGQSNASIAAVSTLLTSSSAPSAATAPSRGTRISDSEFASLVAALRSEASGNDAKLRRLEDTITQQNALFSCDQLVELMGLTPSVKTRLAMVDLVGPRTWDPKKAQGIIDMFRYSEVSRKGPWGKPP